jgi:hypothetical protein
MTTATVSRSSALRLIVQRAGTRHLAPLGFVADGTRSWVRRTGELGHVIALTSRSHRYQVQWGVVSPEASPILFGSWAAGAREYDVAASVLTGSPGSLRHPAGCPSFRLDPEVETTLIDDVVETLPADLVLCASWLEPLQTRQDLRTFLLANRDDKDRRGFVVPAHLPLKLFTAATLAVLDDDPAADGLEAEARAALAPFADEITTSRLLRLAQLTARTRR